MNFMIVPILGRIVNGADGIRTRDLIRARDALSHLSYCPIWR